MCIFFRSTEYYLPFSFLFPDPFCFCLIPFTLVACICINYAVNAKQISCYRSLQHFCGGFEPYSLLPCKTASRSATLVQQKIVIPMMEIISENYSNLRQNHFLISIPPFIYRRLLYGVLHIYLMLREDQSRRLISVGKSERSPRLSLEVSRYLVLFSIHTIMDS